MGRYRTIVDVMMILARDGHILLAQRRGTGYADGWWNLPSGHLEEGETIDQAAIREAREEVGIDVRPDDLRFVHVCHYRNPEGEGRVGVFFEAGSWDGEPRNAEPHKCARITWFPADRLPASTFPYTVAGVQAYIKGASYAAVGWPDQ
ncbi:DNA mismatch repair protein MutT [Spongiactinospora rosea]|uniref:DNA mismatch repair protein MutT n=1 Tax=Spongiactinospora rosea TaxID=2248750 RepID=A0A366M4P0_9ACTN|nr:NUDIX domain-containing protein [Spongiactinospora rosea]RBQ20720.1 DNA mismatch repair protein MutT [Spongiactinospora rosea]